MWAKDESTGEIALKPIAQTFERVAPSTLALTFSNGETIETTAEHPFYVQDRGFMPAGLVALGNSIVTRAGPSLQVTAIEKHSSPHTVYNFEVEDYHTYFVGESALWTHNAFCDNFSAVKDHANHAKSLSRSERPTVAASFELPDGTRFVGLSRKRGETTQAFQSRVDPDGLAKRYYDKVEGEMRAAGKQPPTTHGNCAEYGLVAEILKLGIDPKDGRSVSVLVGGKQHGVAKRACPSCRVVLAKLGMKDDFKIASKLRWGGQQ